MNPNKDAVKRLVHTTIEENMHLSEQSLEKGFLSIHWKKAQDLWINTTSMTK